VLVRQGIGNNLINTECAGGGWKSQMWREE
jgi:hypothetical protein